MSKANFHFQLPGLKPVHMPHMKEQVEMDMEKKPHMAMDQGRMRAYSCAYSENRPMDAITMKAMKLQQHQLKALPMWKVASWAPLNI